MQVYQVRLLRRLLLGLIALVSLAVLVNYVQIWRRRRDIIKPTTQILSPELLRSATDVKYSATEKGVTKFKVSAKKLLTTREDKEFLEGIDANDFNPDGSERNHISSNMGWYDRVRKQAFFPVMSVFAWAGTSNCAWKRSITASVIRPAIRTTDCGSPLHRRPEQPRVYATTTRAGGLSC